jgi:hypothetical protein
MLAGGENSLMVAVSQNHGVKATLLPQSAHDILGHLPGPFLVDAEVASEFRECIPDYMLL